MDERPDSPAYLDDLSEPNTRAWEGLGGLQKFAESSACAGLRHWPIDVLEQWLYDHADHEPFRRDYGHLDLTQISWAVEPVPLCDLTTMPTGATEANAIEEFAANPEHWVKVRSSGCHLGVRECWEVHGTWKRWPILLDRSLLDSTQVGLQVVEGRTRVGVLRGRARRGLFVAPRHLVWVGRARA